MRIGAAAAYCTMCGKRLSKTSQLQTWLERFAAHQVSPPDRCVMYSTRDMQNFERASNSASLANMPLQHQLELLWLVGGALKLLALATVQEALPKQVMQAAAGALAA